MEHRLKLFFVSFYLIGSLIGSHALADEGWAVTTAIIKPFSEPEIGYEILYETPESTAVNAEGKPIKGPIEQYVTGVEKPVKAQKINIRYQIDEPVMFELLSEIETE